MTEALSHEEVDRLVRDEFRTPQRESLPPHLGDEPLTVEAVRALDDRIVRFEVSAHASVVSIGSDVEVRIHGDAPSAGAVLWIHGGGMFLGAAERDDALCASLAAELGVPVAAVDYRLAPEHPYPAGLDDCLAAVDWLAARHQRIVVAGASAGGGLAAAVALRLRDGGGPEVAGIHAYYPMLDDRSTTASASRLANAPIWNRRLHDLAWSAYCPAGADEYAAPARARRLEGLPPHHLDVGTVDLFVDEVLDYAARLLAAGVEVELHVEPGAPHGWEGIVPDGEASTLTWERRRRSIRRMLEKETP